MSETCGRLTGNMGPAKGVWKTGSCGLALLGANLKIDKPNKDGEGEVMESTINVSGRGLTLSLFSILLIIIRSYKQIRHQPVPALLYIMGRWVLQKN